MNSADLDAWFMRKVVPLEPSLMRYLRRNWRNESDLQDIRQDVYMRVYEAASLAPPTSVQAFVFAIANNLLADRVRRGQIVSIDYLGDMDSFEPTVDELTPERHASGRNELLLLQQALRDLPIRCRTVVELRKIEGLSQVEVAHRLGIAEDTVERHVGNGMRALANALYAKGVRLETKVFASIGLARAKLQ